MDELEYLHKFSIAEQVIMETAKIDAKYDTSKYTDKEWFIIVSEEFGEIAKNMSVSISGKRTKEELQENLEYELLQLITICWKWLQEKRKTAGNKDYTKTK